MDVFKIIVKGTPWKIEFLSKAQYVKKHGEGSLAMTDPEKKTLSFIKGNCSTGVIRHELLHSFVAESHVESSSLNSLQTEELCCTIIETQWENINLLVEQIVSERLK